MKEQSKKQLKAIKSAGIKSLVTTCCGLVAFGLVSLLKVVTDGDGLKEVLVIVLLLVAVMAVYIKYTYSSTTEKRAKATDLSSVLRREALRSSSNSFIVFYTGYEILYAAVGFVILKVESVDKKLPEFLQDRAVLHEPVLHMFQTLGIYFVVSLGVNLLLNYITADAESNADANVEKSSQQI
ncbi:TPA: hypothetical protein RG687_001005 [Vibrio parahaemolyticus]|nr:hypothetical protein [Vibrio parahaemolyticus]